ncbi:pantoate--beta-alanine ligase [Ruania alba]|uniref:pantoate--beta-alanine ligase n=1 Tax=Ruania alba TaxID=648782 RepID=UPI003CCBC9F7
MSSRPGRLGVGVVGAGRVGAVLASALRAAGHAVVGASGSSEESKDRIDALLPHVPVLDVRDVVERSELVLLTVPDDVLADLVSGLARLGAFQPGQLLVHTAGRYGVDVLAPARAAGAIPLAVHPAMTFTGTSVDLGRLEGAPFAVTADAPVLPIAQALVVEIGGEPVVLDESARPLYHAALAHGANHLVTLTAQATRVLAAAGVPEGGTLLRPLLSAALDGALRGGESTLTGPIVRGDSGTVAGHLAALVTLAAQEPSLVDVPETYTGLARATVQRCLATRRITETTAGRLLDALEPASRTATQAAAEGAPETVAGPEVVHTVAELRQRRESWTEPVAVVMTMGALHEGHLALVRHARTVAPKVLVTIFVNPLQFGADEDLDAYPRTLETDVAALAEEGVDLVFAPSVAEMYPDGDPQVTVTSGRMGQVLEGAARPSHFDGMLTVVSKLLHLTRADVSVFGQKDAQQLALVRRLVADQNIGVRIEGVPIVREPDGLAMSSRNVYLDERERAAALVLSRAIRAGASEAADGGSVGDVLAAAHQELDGRHACVQPAYLEVVDERTMEPLAPDSMDRQTPAVLVVAARVGNTRLLDNAVLVWPPQGEAS